MSGETKQFAQGTIFTLEHLPDDIDGLLERADTHFETSECMLAKTKQGRQAYTLLGSFDRQKDTKVIRMIALHQFVREQIAHGKLSAHRLQEQMNQINIRILWDTQRKFTGHEGSNLVLCQDLTVVTSLFRSIRGCLVWTD